MKPSSLRQGGRPALTDRRSLHVGSRSTTLLSTRITINQRYICTGFGPYPDNVIIDDIRRFLAHCHETN